MTRAIKIDPKGYYSMQDIVREKMFPWATSFFSVRNIVMKDSKDRDILKTEIIGRGRGKKYHFKGANIIKFIEIVKATEPWKAAK